MSYKRADHRKAWRRTRRARVVVLNGIDFKFGKLEIAREKYGITTIEYEEYLRSQNNCCAICRRGFTCAKEICVDHSHKTGNVRGLLCFHCNTALGHVFDDQDILTRMKVYLENSYGV